jgi:hypothetical protein
MKRAFHRFRPGRNLLSLAFAGVMTLASAGISTAADTATPTPSPCGLHIGYVCLAESTGGFQLIPAGERRVYPGGLPIDGISNGTDLLYCVAARPFNYGIGPWQERTISLTVLSVSPTDGACLT